MSATDLGTGVRWRQVAEDLRHRIESAEFTGAFPGELALADEYQVSRHTIREALRDLRQAGVVTAGRGRTSRVVPGTLIEQPAGTLYSLFESIAATGLTQRSVVHALDVRTDPDAAAELGLPDDAELVFLERLRLADDEPLAVDRVWLPAERARPLLHADFEHTSLYDQLRATCGIHLTGGRERIQAAVATPSDREQLAIDPSIAVLVLDRLGRAGELVLEWRQTRIRADRFSVVAEFAAGAYRFQHSDRPDGPAGPAGPAAGGAR